MKKYTDNLVLMIVKSDDEKLDGKIFKSSCNNSHLEALKDLKKIVEKEGIIIGSFNTNTSEEAAFDIVKEGHILFFNVYEVLGFLKLPDSISSKQYESLELIADELKEYKTLYEQVIDKEEFSSKEYENNFQLIKKRYNIKK